MTKPHFDLLVRGGILVNHCGRVQADIGIVGSKISGIGDLSASSTDRIVEAAGLHVLPGVIDSQVHFREPGLEHKEDLEAGSRGAVKGGVTTVFEMPNTKPETVTAAALEDKVARARGGQCPGSGSPGTLAGMLRGQSVYGVVDRFPAGARGRWRRGHFARHFPPGRVSLGG